MTVWKMLLAIAAAGALGGIINALLESEGFVLIRLVPLPDGSRILRPGFLGNVLVGAVTSLVLGGLYGPLATVSVSDDIPAGVKLTVGMLVGAIVSGVGGARVLTGEVKKRYADATQRELAETVVNLTGVQNPPKKPGE
jgi:hypothetical protein